jgi:asparaginyl-tRNA synthetase
MFLNRSIKNFKASNTRFFHKIKDIYSSYDHYLNKDIEICGWIRTIRKQKIYNFMHINDGTDSRNIQLIISNEDLKIENLNFGTSIKAKGKLVKSDHPQQTFELLANDIQVISTCDPIKYPFQMKKEYTYDFLRQYPHLRSNLTIFANILRARSHINNLVHQFFLKNNLVHIQTPIITQNTCEGGCEVFEVNAIKTTDKYFIQPAYLTPSAQLHLETLTNSLGNVYTISPSFRAEKSLTRHHLAEFYMIEAELIGMENIEDLLDFVEDFVKNVCLGAYETIPNHDLEFIFNYGNTKKSTNLFENYKNEMITVLSQKFVRLTYDEAIKLVNKNGKLKKLDYGDDLGKEHEKYIIKHFENVPVFVTKYPKSLKPFYMKTNSDNGDLVDNFDLLVHDVGELVGGSLRESNYNVLVGNMKSRNINIDDYKMYLESKEFGGMMMGK